MKKTIFALAAALTLAGGVRPVAAKTVAQCVIEAVADCDARFPPSDRYLVSIRGWCYIIYSGICKAME
jgi:hypothetical protein